MSDPVALRDLPPVEPVKPPSRFSQTMLGHFNRCQRSAYLYVKWRGGAPSHELDRGTVGHRAFMRYMEHLVSEGESRLPFEVAKDIMAEEIGRASDLTIPAEQQASLRVMAYHFAEGVAIDPALVSGIEQKFVLEVGDFLVVGVLDVSFSEDGTEVDIWDYKTSMAMASYDEIAEKLRSGRLAPKSFQLILYALLYAFGRPELPDGSLGEPLGERAHVFRLREVYPMFLFDDGLGHREVTLERSELIDHRLMLEGHVLKAAQKFGLAPGGEPWKFEAVPGSHCQECPAKAECPLPAHLRTWAGEVNDVEQAQEALEKLFLDEKHLRARRKELNTFASLHGPILFGGDMVADFKEETRVQTDKGSLAGAVSDAVNFGEPFDVADHQKVSRYSKFRLRKLEPGEFDEEVSGEQSSGDGESEGVDAGGAAVGGSKFGDDAPF